ncbi:hypothetical protein [Paenibacillus soyae]|uniref:Uncharacterized protein n=1 Tax=Paenibacillus soyae TaxID=2969249 RepID=A0A9X2MU92_9BACL|nr:hypothetical protein [Paenibacillus soyae]MCR2805953.1 hypothetical protein [Paenibacillus soyae]
MKAEQVIKWLGFGCLLAGIARIGMTPSSYAWGSDSPEELTFGLIACVLMAIFSIAFFLVQSRETGILGFITAVFIMIGNLLTACILWGKLHYGHYGEEDGLLIAVTGMVSSAGVLGGSVLLPILSWRAKVFPRWVIMLMIANVLALALPWTEWFALFWGLPYIAMGYCIWRGRLNAGQSADKGVAV